MNDNISELERNKWEGEVIGFLDSAPADFRHMDRASYPYNRPLDPLRRYDIISLESTLSKTINVNYFFIIIIRDLIRSTISSYKRFDEGINTLRKCAKVQESNLLFIQSQLRLIDPSKYIIIDYDDICKNKNNLEQLLQTKSKMNDLAFNTAEIMSKSTTIEQNIYADEVKQLEAFFDLKRKKQFNFLQENITLLTPKVLDQEVFTL